MEEEAKLGSAITSLSWTILVFQISLATFIPATLPALKYTRKAIYLIQFLSFQGFLAKHSDKIVLGFYTGSYSFPLLFNWYEMEDYRNTFMRTCGESCQGMGFKQFLFDPWYKIAFIIFELIFMFLAFIWLLDSFSFQGYFKTQEEKDLEKLMNLAIENRSFCNFSM